MKNILLINELKSRLPSDLYTELVMSKRLEELRRCPKLAAGSRCVVYEKTDFSLGFCFVVRVFWRA